MMIVVAAGIVTDGVAAVRRRVMIVVRRLRTGETRARAGKRDHATQNGAQ